MSDTMLTAACPRMGARKVNQECFTVDFILSIPGGAKIDPVSRPIPEFPHAQFPLEILFGYQGTA